MKAEIAWSVGNSCSHDGYCLEFHLYACNVTLLPNPSHRAILDSNETICTRVI
jgi:hypothetical protein